MPRFFAKLRAMHCRFDGASELSYLGVCYGSSHYPCIYICFSIPPLNKVRGPARIASAKWSVLRRLMLMKWLTPHGTAADLSRGVESEYGMEQILL